MKHLSALALVLLAMIALAACGGDDEGELTVYSGREEELIGSLIEDIAEREDMAIEVRYGETPELAAAIREEGESSPADVFFSQDAGALGALDAEGLLAKLPEDVLGQVPEQFRGDAGTWVGTSGRARVIAYGPDVPREELPDSVLELTRPEWRGRVGWAPTNGSFQAFVTGMRVTLGQERTRSWLEGMVANDTQSYSENSAIRDAIAAGEIDAGLINHYYVAEAQKEDPDYPVEVHFPPGDIGSMINVAGVGILESSDSRDEALTFARALLTPAAQKYLAEGELEYPIVPGVPADPSLVPLKEIPDPGVDLSSIDDLEGTLNLLQETGAL